MRNKRWKKSRSNVEPYTLPNSSSASSSTSSTSTDNAPELPGFYYDPEKKRYFKIQANNFGQVNIPTRESINQRDEQSQLEKTIRKQSTQRDNYTLKYLLNTEVNGWSASRREHDELTIRHSSLGQFKSFSSPNIFTDGLNKLKVMRVNSRLVLVRMFHNYRRLYDMKMFDITDMFENTKINSNLNRIREIKLDGLDFLGSLAPLIFGPNNSLVYFDAEYYFKYITYRLKKLPSSSSSEMLISEWDQIDYSDEILEKYRNNSSPLCGDISPDCSMLAMGHTDSIRLVSLDEDSIHDWLTLDTSKHNEFIRVEFQKTRPNLLIAGCRNRSILSFDWRQKSQSKCLSEIKLASTLCDFKIHSSNSNYIFSYEYSGEASLWDLRSTKNCVSVYSNNVRADQNCSITTDSSSRYLYQSSKDCNIRIYDVLTSNLIRTIMTQEKIDPSTNSNNFFRCFPPQMCLVEDSLDLLCGFGNEILIFQS